MRQIVLDTETTGLDPKHGHRIIEIGCVELIDRRLTGNNYHQYINPQREIDAGALAVHGISNKFLSDKPVFGDIAKAFIDYVDGAELIIHNAKFDLGFLNHEYRLQDKKFTSFEKQCSVIDTLTMARQMHPGQKNNLDALCKRYAVDNSNRDLHGALLDAEILSWVYLAMTGGQSSLFVDETKAVNPQQPMNHDIKRVDKERPALVVVKATDEESAEHKRYLKMLNKISNGKCGWEE